MKKLILAFLLISQLSLWGQVDQAALQRYLGGPSSDLYKAFTTWNSLAPGKRPGGPATNSLTLQSLLPFRRPFTIPGYIRDRAAAIPSLIQQVSDNQLNKMVAGTVGNAGATSLVAGSAVSDVMSLATEYGAINQTTSGNTTTVRGNLAGVAGFFMGDPYLGCSSLAADKCSSTARLARSFSASLSFETGDATGTKTVSGTNAATGAPASTQIPANGNRMSAWSVRYDLFHKNLYDTKQFQAFSTAIKTASASPEEKTLNDSVQALIASVANGIQISTFEATLQNAPAGHLADALQDVIDAAIQTMTAKDPDLMTKVRRAANAVAATMQQRDAILNDLQSNKFSVEFNGLHPLGQPNLSNVRLIYSYQPTKGPLLFTFNGAVEWYDSLPSGVTTSRLRDIQASAQVDRNLGTIGNFGSAVLTAAFYYQWMRDKALLTIPAGDTVPGTGIVLPGAASTLLAPSGPIDIGQVKITLPIKSGVVKVPVSFTWSNRTELINESEKRGQVGLTLDMDALFRK